MSKKFLTAKEASAKLGVQPITMRVWLKKGLFPNAILDEVESFGKIWRIPENDVESFVKPEMGRPKVKKK